ncbi:MAG: YdeI/OmpD-associated family protein [Chloroflexota bacterium]|nr:YdeI/OmpD-associated family protein [Lentimicrobium sp.]
MATPQPQEIMEFETSELWELWLSGNFSKPEGIWLKIAKKGTGVTTVTYIEALEVALCYGWIDGQMKSVDNTYFVQKFTPRRTKSIWSKINTERVERLINEGRMKDPGYEQIEKAKADGRWDQAYGSSKNSSLPEDFLKVLKENKFAFEFFKSLNRTNLYAIYFRLETAKRPETREKRIKEIVEMLSQGKKYH